MKVLDENHKEVQLIETSEYNNTDYNSVMVEDNKNFAFEENVDFAAQGYTEHEVGEESDLESEEYEDLDAEAFSADSFEEE